MGDRERELIKLLGDTPKAGRFIGWVLPRLDAVDADNFTGKMKRESDEYQQIAAVYKRTKQLHQAIEALSDPARMRLSASGWWESERIPQDLFDLMFAAGNVLDQDALKHGEKQTLNPADIARVRIIAHGFHTILRRKVSKSATSVFYAVVAILLDSPKSPKTLIEKACRL